MRPRRSAARAARQGRDARRQVEDERTFASYVEHAVSEMERTGAIAWPPLTGEQLLSLRAEDLADERIAREPHRFQANFPSSWSCVHCQRPRRAHIHYSRRDYQDFIQAALLDLRGRDLQAGGHGA